MLYLAPDPEDPNLIAVLDARLVEIRFVVLRGHLVAGVHAGRRLVAVMVTGVA